MELPMSYVLNGYTTPSGVASSEDVKAFQHGLNSAGASLKVDGVWGPKTQAAYESYLSNQYSNTISTSAPPSYDIGSAYDKAASNYRSALDAAYRMQEQNLNAQAEELARQADAARSQAYVNARLDAIGNNEVLAAKGLAGNLYGEAKSGVSETARIAEDVAMRNGINAITNTETEQRNQIAMRILEAGLTRDYEYALKLADLEIAKANAEQDSLQQAWENQMAMAKFQYQMQQDAAKQSGSTSGGHRPVREQETPLVSPEEIERWLSLLTPKERGEVYKGVGEQNKEYRQEILDSVGPDLADQMMRSFNMFLYSEPGLRRKSGTGYWTK
jgi:hypothetical protein